jgi:hypothetical protein
MLVPEHIQSKVLAVVWREADDADWDHQTQAEKARLLERWISSEDVGGLLSPLLLTDAAVRLWLKDVAIKKRARSKMPNAHAIVALSHITGSVVVPSAGIKPHHCLVDLDEGGRMYLCWGTAANAKHLIWAALNARLDQAAVTGSRVVFIDFGLSATKPAQRERLRLIAQRCDVGIEWLSV